MRLQRFIASVLVGVFWLWSLILPSTDASAQNALPTPDQLDQLLAPVALYPDALLAQICAASTDPQQILDVDNWLHQTGLSGQALTNAAQAQGFDPAFVALVNFPQVLDMMAQNIDSYAAIGQAFASNQGMVMDSVQRLRQQAYSSGTLESNQYQAVSVQPQGTTQVVVIQPANPQVVYVPQYNPQVVYAAPSTAAVVTASLLSFGAGIALGAWISNNSYPWGWGGWGWNWGRRTVIVHNNIWVVNNNRYRPRRPTYHYRPPVYNRPVYVRPPSNWHDRPNYRPPSGGGRPPAGNPGNRPPVNPPPRPAPQPPRPSPPSGQRPPNGGNRPNQGGNRPSQPLPQPTPRPVQRPTGRPQQQPKPNTGYGKGPANPQGGRTSAFGGGNNAGADRTAINRGKASVASQAKQKGGGKR